MSSLPGDPNLPPGVTNKMIEDQMGDESYCANCGIELTPEEASSKNHDGECNSCWRQHDNLSE